MFVCEARLFGRRSKSGSRASTYGGGGCEEALVETMVAAGILSLRKFNAERKQRGRSGRSFLVKWSRFEHNRRTSPLHPTGAARLVPCGSTSHQRPRWPA